MTARRAGSGRRSRWAAGVAFVGAALALASAQLGGCTRRADIRDEPDGGAVKPPPQFDAGDIPELDSGLDTDAFMACEDRPYGACNGPVDFPCAFQSWVSNTAMDCQEATGCKTNGWLEVQLSADGCVAAIGMDQPNDEIVACLLEELGSLRCPCDEDETTHFFGIGNDGVCPDGGKPPG